LTQWADEMYARLCILRELWNLQSAEGLSVHDGCGNSGATSGVIQAIIKLVWINGS
jgi:hypothetical protein